MKIWRNITFFVWLIVSASLHAGEVVDLLPFDPKDCTKIFTINNVDGEMHVEWFKGEAKDHDVQNLLATKKIKITENGGYLIFIWENEKYLSFGRASALLSDHVLFKIHKVDGKNMISCRGLRSYDTFSLSLREYLATK
jgi:hypothetical protein